MEKVWSRIDAKLDTKVEKRNTNNWRKLAVAATVLIAGFVGYQLYTSEETQIIPEALKVLTPEDWASVDAAFARNADPLSTTQPRDPIYDRLFSKITLRAPAPIGLGHS